MSTKVFLFAPGRWGVKIGARLRRVRNLRTLAPGRFIARGRGGYFLTRGILRRERKGWVIR